LCLPLRGLILAIISYSVLVIVLVSTTTSLHTMLVV
jgi:hypothetical protein